MHFLFLNRLFDPSRAFQLYFNNGFQAGEKNNKWVTLLILNDVLNVNFGKLWKMNMHSKCNARNVK